MTMSSSSHHHFVLCLFLLSFLCVNSQLPHDVFIVIIKNETPSVVKKDCSLFEQHPTVGKIKLKPGEVDNITESIMPGRNTLDCLMTLGGKFGFFNLFNLDDTSICHIPNEECLWKIQEDGLCMFSQGKCVMFEWETTLSIRHTASELVRYNNIASESRKYIASDEPKNEHIIWRRTP